MSYRNIGVYIGSKIPNVLRRSIEKAVKAGNYLNVSDFVRVAIKEKIDRDEILYSNDGNEDQLMEN
jgi:Arc/MetJ-type ribon-helix-helix transcriptional regulator